jgi:glucose-6-phosphate 1-dehydrogenase
VLIELKLPPWAMWYGHEAEPGRGNYIRFRFNPDVVIAVGARAKTPGPMLVGEQRELELMNQYPDEMTAYERLLGDALAGDNLLFTREDAVEEAWRVVEPVLTHHHKAHPYEPGTWGPKAADDLIAAAGGWHQPAVTVPAGTETAPA